MWKFLARWSVAAAVLACVGGGVPGALAKDLFVKAGATNGDGSQQKPFGDPFEALDKCEANDVIHITQGRYTGKLESGEWNIPFEGVQLVGGYSADWSERDPWHHPTMLVWDRNAKNRPTDERITSTMKGVVLDGLVLDGVEQNEYSDDAKSGREQRDLDKSSAMVRLALPSTVRNCVFLNTGREGVVCANGSTIENNLFMNVFESGLKINGLPPASADAKTPAIVRNNTFVWSWDDRAPGTGRFGGAGISMSGPATITNNIFAHCDNSAIYCTIDPARSSITHNVFFMNLWGNLKVGVDGKDVVVDDKTMDLMEEVGLKAFDGNEAKSPGLALDPAWLEAAAKRTAAEPGKVTMDDWNQLRQALGMDLQGDAGKPASGVAPAYPLDKAMALLTPKDPSMKAGARMVKLEVHFAGPVAAGPERNYQKTDITSWAENPESVDGKALEMVVAVSNVANVTGIPASYKPDDYAGIFLHDANGQVRITGFFKKGTAVERAVNEAAGNYDGNGKADRLYTVKGVAYVVKSMPKAGFLIESMSPLEAGAAMAAGGKARAVGRDWFVRAGATGGDGTKDKPWRDPYQALEKAEAGDTIHVAGGEYVGKLRAGSWKVDVPDVTMLGGYDQNFQTRDPWKNITLLYCPADFKGTRGGYTLQGDGDHSGFILDGFVFDKRANNVYTDKGDLQVEESDKSEHLWLSRPGCVVRNCVFMNGAAGAVRLTSGQTIENCIFLNHYGLAVRIERGMSNDPVIFRNNTVAFAWEERFGSGHGIMADLLILEGGVRAIVDNNIFEFADQHAIRLNADPKDVELTNNVFAHNLWAEVYQPSAELVVDNKNFNELQQMGWKKAEGNVLMIPGLPLDPKWFDVYLNRTAYVEGKVERSDWNQMREILGEPPIATGGKPASGLAPAYDRQSAMTLFPKNPDCKAGARPMKLEVKFTGVVKAAQTHEYQDVTWDAAKSADEWDKLAGKRVSLKVVIARDDNQFNLSDAPKEKFSAWMVQGPEGIDSGGLPMRVYVPTGGKVERVFRQAKGYSTGAVDETHVIKGIARENRQMIIEDAEKAD